MKNLRRNYSNYSLHDMEHELVRLVRSLLRDQRYETKTYSALEVKRLLVLMIELYRKEERANDQHGKLNFE